jgi:hypothetical protein
MADESLVLVFIPALAPLLVRAEDAKGSPLTEAEVLRIRDNAICVAMPVDVAAAVEAKRGYRDLNPKDCWVEWQRLRPELGRVEQAAE